jgi:hypothetical protein
VSAPLWSFLGVIGSALVIAGGGWFVQRQVKALGLRKENRDDFVTITERQDKEIDRLGVRLDAAEKSVHEERRMLTTALRFIEQITRQMRAGGLEPPPLPVELADRMWE